MSKETRKGRLWQSGKAKIDAGNRVFSAREKRLE
jgi:hypothetical protein